MAAFQSRRETANTGCESYESVTRPVNPAEKMRHSTQILDQWIDLSIDLPHELEEIRVGFLFPVNDPFVEVLAITAVLEPVPAHAAIVLQQSKIECFLSSGKPLPGGSRLERSPLPHPSAV
jgi:hypothetical protein